MRSLQHMSPPPQKMAARRVPLFHCSTAVGASCQKAPPRHLKKLTGAQRPRSALTHASDGTDNGSYVSAAIIAERLCVLRPFLHTAVSIHKNQLLKQGAHRWKRSTHKPHRIRLASR